LRAGSVVPDLQTRIAALIHPQTGIKRGIIDQIEQGKGSRDPDDRMIPVSIGEIREIHAVLTECAR
jgi:hypothetical protein